MDNRDLLRSFADNPLLMAVVRELIESQFSTDGLKQAEDDIKLGQLVRARLVGLEAIEKAFKEISQFRTVPKQPEKTNPAI